MPSIQAMRSDAMAMRAKEDVLEKVPSFFNSVNQALGQSIVQAQDGADQLAVSRADAANRALAGIKSRIEGKGGMVEQGVNNSIKMVTMIVDGIQTALGQIDPYVIAKTALDVSAFVADQYAYSLQFNTVTLDYLQFTVQAGYTGNLAGFSLLPSSGITPTVNPQDMISMGGAGAVTRRDAVTPRWTSRRKMTGGPIAYSAAYNFGSVGQMARVGQYNVVA